MPFQKVIFPVISLDIANLAQIRFLGGKLGSVMAEVYEANTVGDLL
jgi:hypothetical protein